MTQGLALICYFLPINIPHSTYTTLISFTDVEMKQTQSKTVINGLKESLEAG